MRNRALAYPGSPGLFLAEMRRKSMSTIKKLFRDETGATAIEYGLIAALIAVASIIAMQSLGSNLNNTFSNVSAKL
jgi:pilus assembly protein Flp/PilA